MNKKLTEEEIQYTIEQSKKLVGNVNVKLTEEEMQYAIEQSKKVVDAKSTDGEDFGYNGMKSMIGFDKKKKR